MVRRILFGVVWCVVLYFGACMVTGGVAGAMAGNRDPANAAVVGRRAGSEAVGALRGYFVVGALLLSVGGTWAGVLPGTRAGKPARRRDF